MRVGEAALGEAALGKTALGKTALGKSALGKTALGEAVLDKAALDKAGVARMRSMVTAADIAIMARIAATDSAVLDRALPAISRAANYSRLWLGIAAGLAASESKWGRRAALRGVAGIAIASATTNVLGKGLVRRLRPTAEVPLPRRLTRVPRSTSFPSGHAASAAAFATGVALEVPALAVPVGALAAAVGASRVVTGVHFPSDVAAGFAIGAGASLLTVRWWPRRQAEPAAASRPRQAAPASPGGEGLVLVLNCGSGTASDELAASLAEELPDASIEVAREGADLPALLEKAAGRARILGVAGGDGSVQLAAGLAADKGLPLLVIPAGTFNHFATDLGVRSAAEALAALRAGDSVLVDLALAGQRTFLNTASTGVYVDLVRAREELEKRLGKWPAVVVALVRVLRSSTPQDLVVDGRRRRVWLLFAGNCRYEPEGAAPSYRPDLRDGQLDIRMVDGSQPLARARLITAVAMGTLARSRVYRTWTAAELAIRTRDGSPVELSTDGEVVTGDPAVILHKRRDPLLVYRPEG
ncbi:MAG TPA: phosphatase PAP2 family protein [Streptosporangiaceae bacterium]|nr:phosphatase PAP2 family protein [Streptosporangiaceae bacterium]